MQSKKQLQKNAKCAAAASVLCLAYLRNCCLGHTTCRPGAWNLSLLSLYSICFSHTLFSQRCYAVNHDGKIPFPSISGRLLSSIIREINRTGPISCLVPFESAKLLRTSKKISQFIWDLLFLVCKCQTETHTQSSKPLSQSHTCFLHLRDQLFGSRNSQMRH